MISLQLNAVHGGYFVAEFLQGDFFQLISVQVDLVLTELSTGLSVRS